MNDTQNIPNPSGYLLVDKPAGWTSFDVVAKVRGRLQSQLRLETGERHKLKVGHTGTLDPMATGLMIILVGSQTKKAAELSKQDKTYQAELTFGALSSTGDAEGQLTPVVGLDGLAQPTLEQITQVLDQFTGEIWQTPPVYSAIKVNGQRAYKLARQGKEVTIEPRQIKVYSFASVSYSWPKLSFTVAVSSGTYIRSLAADIGQQLGVGAYLSGLRRTKVGEWSIKDALEPSDVSLECF